jgi:aminomethyltransferase
MTTKRTPLYDVGMAAGAQMREMFGYWLPWQYGTGHVEEHLGTRNRVSVCDLDYMAEFRIVGSDALRFVETLLTNDFRSLQIGRVRYTAMCADDGNMVDDGTLWRLAEDEYVLITGSANDFSWISSQASQFAVDVSEVTSKWTTLAIQGPESRSVVHALVGSAAEELAYYGFVRTSVNGSQCLLARMGYTGELGYEFHLVPDDAEALWNALFEVGHDKAVVPCGQAALESLRQEAGYLLVGSDHDPTTNPFEAGIGRVVRFDKTEFNGREALAALRRGGVNRRMVWMKLADATVVNKGDAVVVDELQIGDVTSGSYSPTQKNGVAMGYVQSNYAISGIGVDIRSSGKTVSASMSTMPLYDPGDVRTRQH